MESWTKKLNLFRRKMKAEFYKITVKKSGDIPRLETSRKKNKIETSITLIANIYIMGVTRLT